MLIAQERESDAGTDADIATTPGDPEDRPDRASHKERGSVFRRNINRRYTHGAVIDLRTVVIRVNVA